MNNNILKIKNNINSIKNTFKYNTNYESFENNVYIAINSICDSIDSIINIINNIKKDETMCNRCRSDIKKCVNNNSSYDKDKPYYELTLRKYTCDGELINEKEYHLCNRCGNIANDLIEDEFI